MSRYIKLNGVRFSNPNLPILRDLSAEVAALPGLMDWFTAAPAYITTDTSGLVQSWSGRVGGTTFTPALSGKPSFITDAASGRAAVHFTDSVVMPLTWSGVFPTGLTETGKFTKILISRLGIAADTNNKFLLGYWNNPTDNDGYHHIRYEPALARIGSVVDSSGTTGGGTVDIENPAIINNPSLIGSACDPVAQKNTVMVNGQVLSATYAAGSAQVDESGLWLGNIGGAGGSVRGPEMNVFDVLVFNADILGDVSNAASLEVVRAYAKSRLGIV